MKNKTKKITKKGMKLLKNNKCKDDFKHKTLNELFTCPHCSILFDKKYHK